MPSHSRDHDEKRNFIRLTVDCRVSFKDADGNEHHGRALNVSGGGVLFITDKPLPLGGEYAVSVNPDTPVIQPLELMATVMRVDRVDGKFEIGMKINKRL